MSREQDILDKIKDLENQETLHNQCSEQITKEIEQTVMVVDLLKKNTEKLETMFQENQTRKKELENKFINQCNSLKSHKEAHNVEILNYQNILKVLETENIDLKQTYEERNRTSVALGNYLF